MFKWAAPGGSNRKIPTILAQNLPNVAHTEVMCPGAAGAAAGDLVECGLGPARGEAAPYTSSSVRERTSPKRESAGGGSVR